MTVRFTTHEVGEQGRGVARAVSDSLEAARELDFAVDWALPEDLLAMPGYSGRRYREFVNNLVSVGVFTQPVRYLEVGAWQGSTLCSALCGNHVRATVIDNWSEFGGPREAFFANLDRWKGGNEVTVIERDFRTVDFASLGKHEVYLFDGPHEEQDQYDGITMAMPALADQFVLIIDDWNWDRVRQGALRAIRDLRLDMSYAVEIRTTDDDTHPAVFGPESDWHNGYFIGVCRKP